MTLLRPKVLSAPEWPPELDPKNPEYQKRNFPLPVYSFRVTVGSEPMSFAEVSGLAVDYTDVTYRHGLSFLEGERIQTFYFNSFVSVTCKRGTVLRQKPPGAELEPTPLLYEWLK